MFSESLFNLNQLEIFLKFMINNLFKLARVSMGVQNICVIGENNKMRVWWLEGKIIAVK